MLSAIIFISILVAFALLDAWVAFRLASVLKAARRARLWRIAIFAWIATMYATLIINIELPSLAGQSWRLIPRGFSASVYIWHLLVLLSTAISLLIAGVIGRLRQRGRAQSVKADGATITRRQMLAMTAVAIPPLATFSLTGVAMAQLGTFRIKKYDLPCVGWPAALDGLTIALIADIHTGVFTTQKMLDDIVEKTNQLRADITLLAGDLINLSLKDLPVALDMVMRLDGRHGVYMIQGNHDVIQDPDIFNAQTKARGVRLLLDEIQTLRPRGVPIQLLGTKWPRPLKAHMDEPIAALARQRDPDAFPILLAHHPHSWDAAQQNNLPLTLAGHTHGGQVMLTDHIGAGPIKFKYWSGLYQNNNSQLIVSNGVGNWFPVRLNAPAEIVHITMHPKTQSAI